MLRALPGLICSLGLVLLIVACGGDGKAQELRVNLGAEPGTLDPQVATTLPEFSVLRQLFQGLLGLTPELGLEPQVAREVPSLENEGISGDGLVYTFRLRDNATWSDGEALTASDFVYTFQRLLDPAMGAPYSQLFSSIAGAQEYMMAVQADASTKASLRSGLAVEAVDNHTLRFTLTEPNPTFLQKMALVAAFPVRQDVVEQAGPQWTEPQNFVGNGPYTLAEWAHQDHITLEVNGNYWGSEPKLDRMTFRMVSDPNAELSAYRNGELDLARLPPGTEGAVLDDATLGSQVVRSTDLATFAVFFNTGTVPFNDIKVRRAFASAIDREGWVDKVSNGVGEVATGWLPPGMPAFDAQVGAEYAYNPQKAAGLLAEAGFSGGQGFPSVSFPFIAAGGQQTMAEYIQAQLEDSLGVDVDLEPLDPPSFFQRVLGAGDFDITVLSWSADYPDPESFLAPLFASGSPNNLARYMNPEFDQLVGQASQELQNDQRLELWHQAHQVMMADTPIAPFFYQERLFLRSPSVRGLTLTAIDGAIPGDTRLTEVSLVR